MDYRLVYDREFRLWLVNSYLKSFYKIESVPTHYKVLIRLLSINRQALSEGAPFFKRASGRSSLVFANSKMLKERLIKTILFICAVSSIGIVFFIVIYMVSLGYPTLVNWFSYGFQGILGYMFGTVYLALGGTLLGIAFGLPCAIYLAEFSNHRLRNIIKPTLEVLNGFPSVVLGILGFTLIATQMDRFGIRTMYCTLVGWIVLGVMSIPLIASVSEDSIRAVPHELREAALGIGATKWQTTLSVLLPSAFSGILTASLLALMNAIGETMAVLFVIGLLTPPPITLDPLSQSNCITALIAYGYQETSMGSPEYLRLFAAGTVLFIMTALLNLAIRAVIARRNKTNVSTGAKQ